MERERESCFFEFLKYHTLAINIHIEPCGVDLTLRCDGALWQSTPAGDKPRRSLNCVEIKLPRTSTCTSTAPAVPMRNWILIVAVVTHAHTRGAGWIFLKLTYVPVDEWQRRSLRHPSPVRMCIPVGALNYLLCSPAAARRHRAGGTNNLTRPQ